VFGQRGIFLASAVLTLIGLGIIGIASRTTKSTHMNQIPAST
jgi:hypothetical protein